MRGRTDFADRLLTWWRRHGRHNLPWQKPRSPYRVWVAEIMLQQTRVDTVIPYFQNFLEAFPTLADLAAADADRVLAHWSGLGYYARARNLHAAARICVDQHGGALPDDRAALEALPGIGRSTAGAIRALGFGRPAPILDGNVKRVMARHAGIEGWPGRIAVTRKLWNEAAARTPDHDAAAYAQAIMDLGALLCTRRRPDCGRCPVAKDCIARGSQRQEQLPTPRPGRHLPEHGQRFLFIRDAGGRILLTRRPPAGIWGGLWCLPHAADLSGRHLEPDGDGLSLTHTFTHFRLHIRIDCLRQTRASGRAGESGWRWLEPADLAGLGLPQPIRRAIDELCARTPSMRQ